MSFTLGLLHSIPKAPALLLGLALIGSWQLSPPLTILSQATGGLVNSITAIITNSTVFSFRVLDEAKAEAAELYRGIKVSLMRNEGVTWCAEDLPLSHPASSVVDSFK